MKKTLRLLLSLFFAALGLGVGALLSAFPFFWAQNFYVLPFVYAMPALIFGIIGFFISPRIMINVRKTTIWMETRLQKMPVADLLAGVIGLIIGLVIASLFSVTMSRIPFVGTYFSLAAVLFFGYIGINIGLKKRGEVLLFLKSTRFSLKDRQKSVSAAADSSQGPRPASAKRAKLLDTSVIIDGRVADICKSGFLEGPLLIPSFVLTELQHIADSADTLKRNRGRRGLDILNAMHKDLGQQVQIEEVDFPELPEVDAKLVRLAQTLSSDILTNDYNLNKVAKLQDIHVLNINELANALKPFLMPGEEFGIHVLREGKENNQGVGYLDDGTMIVVESGKRYINSTILVVVTSVLQTAAGRMIFAKPKFNDKRVYVEENAIG
jgi:uncharacterized protein YacL